jgi:hypothetical protein
MANSRFAWRWLLALCAIGLGLLGSGTAAQDEHPFPMAPGTYWIYRGTVRWTRAGSDEVNEAQIRWRTEVRRVVVHGAIRGIVISGFPFDLAWSDDQPKLSDSLLVESDGKFYLIGGEQFPGAVRRLDQVSDSLEGLLLEKDIVLEWPLRTRRKYCEPEGMSRPDQRYCWIVASRQKGPLPHVAGVSNGDRDQFGLEYWTNPDHIRFTFVPDVGITAYEYHHHGTVADTELRLVEFHAVQARPD